MPGSSATDAEDHAVRRHRAACRPAASARCNPSPRWRSCTGWSRRRSEARRRAPRRRARRRLRLDAVEGVRGQRRGRGGPPAALEQHESAQPRVARIGRADAAQVEVGRGIARREAGAGGVAGEEDVGVAREAALAAATTASMSRLKTSEVQLAMNGASVVVLKKTARRFGPATRSGCNGRPSSVAIVPVERDLRIPQGAGDAARRRDLRAARCADRSPTARRRARGPPACAG